ncbi:hypothetical protein HMPREF9336_00756 [Segniliparus rugosus ATCC BAA-974]|uniref:Uncharacterized protein n=1 Tax=Segniliparus rugosus (strain ATCC BAA-974 / DSM 45345 / CCUG 50838 / CIP 108380 / JCM 13579 / CDC 945) TaxID=679197 RepID=E5XMN6_SEGRC|nr:hypothetical protein HMPREF9336_00756 [Segniliparus rugosus ATCC BAA-974]
MENKVSFFRGLRDAVHVLAGDEKTQLAYLQPLSADVDELALVFSDHYVPVQNWYAELGVDAQAAGALAELDRQLESFSGAEHAGLWTYEALESAAQWQVVRDLAAKALLLMADA